MVTRIGDLAQNQRLTTTMLAAQTRLRLAQAAASSGKAATRFDQIADQAGQLVRLKDARDLKATFLERNEGLTGRLQLMDQALGNVVELADRARASLVQRLDGSLGSAVPLDAEIDAMLAEIERALNTRLDGRYLFAGSRTDTAPVALPAAPITTADPSLYYRGDAVEQSVRVDSGAEIAYGITADDPAFADLLAALGQARTAHLADDRAGLQTAMAGLGTALDRLTDVRAEIGTKAARLESVADAHRAGLVYLDEMISGIEDADLAEVLTRIASDQASLEAAYTVTGRLASLSLVNYLR
ncbi:MAG: flagellin [Geminicoccaceae bacterium]